MNIEALKNGYENGGLTPTGIVEEIFARIADEGVHPVWISVVPKEQVLAQVAALPADKAAMPLWGVPFAVKDNIDVAGMPTTAGCPAYAYTPAETAPVVRALLATGAILIGKTNMDQFATGLVGTRSPYGACSSVFSKTHISGGSSSGSAVAVASGLVSFALGTDTAGSGRVPAMFNNIVGLKPTRGQISTEGVVPACRSLDCVSIFAETATDALAVFNVAAEMGVPDPKPIGPGTREGAAPWVAASSFRFGVPAAQQMDFFGDEQNPNVLRAAIHALEQLGGQPVQFDLAPFLEAANLLYGGPWIAERLAAVGDFCAAHPGEVNPVVGGILAGAAHYSAVDAFRGMYQLEVLASVTREIMQSFDVMVLPTAPRTYTIAEIAESPVERNSHLGKYTSFVNLLNLAAVAVPAGLRPDGLPFGVQLIGPAHTDVALLRLADRLQRKAFTLLGAGPRRLDVPLQPESTSLRAPEECLLMVVVGAHLSGQPLNWQLTQRGGRLIRVMRTAPQYRLYALKNTTPLKPGLVREPGFQGDGIEVEVWALPANTVGSFVDGVPQPLTIGKLELADGSLVMGFLVEPAAVSDATEITHFGGWRAYLASR